MEQQNEMTRKDAEGETICKDCLRAELATLDEMVIRFAMRLGVADVVDRPAFGGEVVVDPPNGDQAVEQGNGEDEPGEVELDFDQAAAWISDCDQVYVSGCEAKGEVEVVEDSETFNIQISHSLAWTGLYRSTFKRAICKPGLLLVETQDGSSMLVEAR